MFKILAKINKLLLPSFTKRSLDISKAKKWQLALIGWRYWVTKHALGKVGEYFKNYLFGTCTCDINTYICSLKKALWRN